MQPQMPQMPPTGLNDLQMIIFVAAGFKAGGVAIKEAVTEAIELVAEAVSQYDGGRSVQALVQKKNPAVVEEAKARMESTKSGLMVPAGTIDPRLLERNRQRQ